MFGIKRHQQGRQRPQEQSERRGSAVFSYHSATRNSARPEAGNTGRDVFAQQRSQTAAELRATGQHSPWVRRVSVMTGVALLVALLLNSLFLDTKPRLQVQKGSSSSALLRDQAVYAQAATQLLSSSPINRLKPAVNSQKIADELAKQFPELGKVTLLMPFFGHQPVLSVEPAVPALIMSSESQPYVIDTAGRAILTPTDAPAAGKLGLPVVTDQSGLPLSAGKTVLPSTTVGFITEVAGQLKAAKIVISSLTLPKGTSELDVRIDGKPYFIKFNLMGNARVESGAFLAVKQRLEGEQKTPEGYIDVRVEGRAYYK